MSPRRYQPPNSATGTGGASRTRSGRHFGEHFDEAVNDLLDQHPVVALAHDADDRLGARGAHHEPALSVEALFRRGDRGANVCMLERLASLVADVLHHLRQRLEAVANLGYRP